MKWLDRMTGSSDSSNKPMRTFLQSIKIFEELSWLELRRLELIIHRRTYDPGEVVFYEGEPGVGMYIVHAGKIDLIKEGHAKERPLTTFRTGDFFGEVALLTEMPRTATAKAAESTVLLGFFRPDLLNLLTSHPKMGSKVLLGIAQVVATRLVHTAASKAETAPPSMA